MIATMLPADFRAMFRMNYAPYLRAMKNTTWNEPVERAHTDKISEGIQAAEVIKAYLNGGEFNPMTLVYYYPEIYERLDGGAALLHQATGVNGVYDLPRFIFNQIAQRVLERIEIKIRWMNSEPMDRAGVVVTILEEEGYRCALTREALLAGIGHPQTPPYPQYYLDFTLGFHRALNILQSTSSEDCGQKGTSRDLVSNLSIADRSRIIEIIQKRMDWLAVVSVDGASMVISVMGEEGHQCALTPEALFGGMERQLSWGQGFGPYLDFVLAFHQAIKALQQKQGGEQIKDDD